MEYYEHSYTNGMNTNYEGCQFIPKNGAIWFAGIGLHRRTNTDDAVISMTWNIGDDKQEFPEIRPVMMMIVPTSITSIWNEIPH